MNYQITGNEYISLPTPEGERRGGGRVSFLVHAGQGAAGAARQSRADSPLYGGEGSDCRCIQSGRGSIVGFPALRRRSGRFRFSCVYLTPIGERGFMVRLVLENTGDAPQQVRFGVEGEWSQTLHEINETTELNAGREAYESGWNHMFIFSQKPGLPLFAFAPVWPIRSSLRRLTNMPNGRATLCL